LTGHIEDSSEDTFADWNGDRCAHRIDFHATGEAFGRAHGDRADPVLTKVLLDLECQVLLLAADFEVDLKSVIDFGQCAVGRVELDIDNRADDLNDSSFMIHVLLVCVKKGDLFTLPKSGRQWDYSFLE
jgi:hypothetical protein